ncbi:MAG: MBL fold metallo-hydrolase [Anaerolineae bacterium]|nr:MBL fold metallo-hydrolase [Anaerolineae bacterium]
MTITVLYDNNAYDPRLETAWGFACLVEGLEQTILFDTGGDGAMLLRNMGKLQVSPDQVDAVVLSHAHADHTGGLAHFLDQNPDVTVYAPASFSGSFRDAVIDAGGDFVAVAGSHRVCDRARLTGELGTGIREMSLLIQGPEGLLVITGCAHPGIVEIARQSKQLVGLPVDLVMGGFHLGNASAESIGSIAAGLKALGVRRVGPCHCSGDLARRLFEEAYGSGYVRIGVGTQLIVEAAD